MREASHGMQLAFLSVYMSSLLDGMDFMEACIIFILTQFSKSFSKIVEFPAAKSLFHSAAQGDSWDPIFNPPLNVL